MQYYPKILFNLIGNIFKNTLTKDKSKEKKPVCTGIRTHDLEIDNYKYSALTDCAIGHFHLSSDQ